MPPELETTGFPHDYEDRKTGLVVFGILTLLMGLLCALFVPLMAIGQSMAPQGSVGASMHTLVPAMAMYLGIAVVLIWLGIGSIMARRWARALLLVLSASWLVIGIISMGMMIFLLPKITAGINAAQHPAGQAAPPPEMASVVTTIMLIFMGVIYVVIPGAWFLFYRSRHVKATCEALDPVERWTDRTPLPVLAIVLWLPFTSAALVVVAVAYKGVLPFFGAFISGPPGAAVYLIMTVVFAYATWAMYRLRWSGWWIVTISMCLFAISSFLTYSQHNIEELYTLAGYSEQELAQIRQFNFFQGKTMSWVTLFSMIPWMGYLLFLRRYFPGGKADSHPNLADSQ